MCFSLCTSTTAVCSYAVCCACQMQYVWPREVMLGILQESPATCLNAGMVHKGC